MPEVQEVFRMATQKVGPDAGFVNRQHDHRRKQERGRKIGAFAVVAAIGVVAALLTLRSVSDGGRSQPADRPTPRPAVVGPTDPLIERVAPTVEGVSFSLRWPDNGWESSPGAASQLWPRDFSINKSLAGPQGAEAIIFWTSFPYPDQADPCGKLLSPSVGRTTADLAAAVARAPGIDLVSGPSDVTLGGRPAKHVVLTVREDTGCDPGFFYTWPHGGCEGACWLESNVGDTIRVWIVDINGVLLFIEAETSKQSPNVEQEIGQIIESIRFD